MNVSATVKPNSKFEEVTVDCGRFLVKVKESSREGKANSAVIRLLAEHFKIPKSSIKIIGGLKSKNKIVEILDM
jgi:uncharacterized protein YggU (UPF0235/DUF167 family)